MVISVSTARVILLMSVIENRDLFLNVDFIWLVEEDILKKAKRNVSYHYIFSVQSM